MAAPSLPDSEAEIGRFGTNSSMLSMPLSCVAEASVGLIDTFAGGLRLRDIQPARAGAGAREVGITPERSPVGGDGHGGRRGGAGRAPGGGDGPCAWSAALPGVPGPFVSLTRREPGARVSYDALPAR